METEKSTKSNITVYALRLRVFSCRGVMKLFTFAVFTFMAE